MFKLDGSRSMLGPLTYFRYPIGPMLLRNTWVQGPPHLFFCNLINAYNNNNNKNNQSSVLGPAFRVQKSHFWDPLI